MLVELEPSLELTERDHWVFESLVPEDHLLARARECIDWTRFDKRLRKYYSEKLGQPSYPPLLMFKLEFLRYLYNLADRPIIQRAATDVAFRYFLNISAAFRLPDASSLCRFRGRIGPDGFHELFQERA
jgi:transposase